MPELAPLAAFHLLRPVWLLGIGGAALLFWLHGQSGSVERRWRHLVAPHLLSHLTVEGSNKRFFRPAHLTFLFLALASVALAGPSWVRERPPFVQDKAALVLVLEASTSMNAIDVQPTRMERAKQKVRDLLARRAGARTALITYAGGAHLVLPLTDDRGILEMYVNALEPALLPKPGDHPAAALALAESLLEGDPESGSILFLTDGIPPEDRAAFASHGRVGRSKVLLLGLGTEQGGPIRDGEGFAVDRSGDRIQVRLDRAGFEATAAEADAFYTYVSVDERDVDDIESHVQRNLAAVQEADEALRWKDFGYYLLFPLLLVMAFWFRRGWSVRWAAIVLLALSCCAAEPAYADESTGSNLWWTQDQQGRRHFEAGAYAEAAAHFENPLWRGTAWYAAGEWEKAVDQFARLDTAEAWFNLGNAHAHLGQYDQALSSYDKALERDPDFERARANRMFMAALIERKKKEEEEDAPAEGGDLLGADDVVEADPNDKRKRPEVEETVEGGQTMDESMAEIWMRQVQTTPAGFLKSKFAFQDAERGVGSARKEDEVK